MSEFKALLCCECRHSMWRTELADGDLSSDMRCMHPDVIRHDAAALVERHPVGSSAWAERGRRHAYQCGMVGALWEPAGPADIDPPPRRP